MSHPSGDEQEGQFTSRYSLVIAVAKRAKQLKEGAPKLVDCKSRNPITVAMEEIKSGKLKVVIPTQEQIEAASRRSELPPVRPGIRETAELLRVPTEFDEDIEDVDEAETGDIEDETSDESAELEMSGDEDLDADEDPVPLDEMEDMPFSDENMGVIESEE